MVPLEYELYAIIYHQRATEALYLLKNDWFTGVYCALVPEIEVRQQYTKHGSFIFLTGLVPKSTSACKATFSHTVALTDSASRNVFLKIFENFKGLF